MAIFASLLCLTRVHQTTAQHFRFKGIEINGTPAEVCQKLEKVGYKTISTVDDLVVLSGEFAGEPCYVAIHFTTQSKLVYSIAVGLDNKENRWTSLKSKYNKFKKSIQEKYNTIPKSVEEFEYPYKEGDGHEMTAVRLDKCSYASKFNLKNGSIMIWIAKKGILCIDYTDKINYEKHRKEQEEQISNDL